MRIDDFHENSRIAGDSRIAVPHPIGDCLLGDQVTAERLENRVINVGISNALRPHLQL